ncbi:MAG: hypothetical protein UU78_C0080G0013, partial [Candidatus Roizmanbacteria bacterium GW2011_GWC2_41_7]
CIDWYTLILIMASLKQFDVYQKLQSAGLGIFSND